MPMVFKDWTDPSGVYESKERELCVLIVECFVAGGSKDNSEQVWVVSVHGAIHGQWDNFPNGQHSCIWFAAGLLFSRANAWYPYIRTRTTWWAHCALQCVSGCQSGRLYNCDLRYFNKYKYSYVQYMCNKKEMTMSFIKTNVLNAFRKNIFRKDMYKSIGLSCPKLSCHIHNITRSIQLFEHFIFGISWIMQRMCYTRHTSPHTRDNTCVFLLHFRQRRAAAGSARVRGCQPGRGHHDLLQWPRDRP